MLETKDNIEGIYRLSIRQISWGLCLMLSVALEAHAANIFVSAPTGAIDNADGFCSISEAIQSANSDTSVNECVAGSGPDKLLFNLDITLDAAVDFTSGQNGTPTISSDIIIDGRGFAMRRDEILGCVIDSAAAAGEFRLMHVSAGGDLSLQNIRLENGCADGNTVDARSGGVLLNEGTLRLIDNSSLSGNQATLGGAIRNDNQVVEILNSAIFGNDASSGGAFYNANTISLVSNTTFSDNTADFGGVIRNLTGGNATMRLATFSGNSAAQGGGVIYNAAQMSVSNSIFANTLNEDDCEAEILFDITGTQNLSDGTCPDTQGSVTNVDATLQDNGCARPHDDGSCPPTHALLPGSNAIDNAVGVIPAPDQRGFATLGSRDLGAFELHHVSVCSAPLQTDGFTTNVATPVALANAIICANLNGTLLDTALLDADITIGSIEQTFDMHDGRNGMPTINSSILIDGQGFELQRAGDCSRDGILDFGEFRLLHISENGELSLNDISMTGGCADDGESLDASSGGAILNRGFITSITEANIVDNNAYLRGGGIYSKSDIQNISDTWFKSNRASNGGGVYITNGGTLGTIINSSFDFNKVPESGGGLYVSPTSAVGLIQNSDFIENSATAGIGGGVTNFGTIGTIENVTFGDNNASAGGGLSNSGTVTLFQHNTLTRNNATTGGGVRIFAGSLVLQNNIISGNSSPDCATTGGTFEGNTNLSDGSCPGTIGDVTFADIPRDNGCVIPLSIGRCVWTQALFAGEAGINASTASTLITDARGFPAVGTRDIGAFEFQGNTACPAALQTDGFDTHVATGTTLREAVVCSNANGPNLDTINLDADITLGNAFDGTDGRNGIPSITGELFLDGQGHVLARDGGLGCVLNASVAAEEFRLLHVGTTGFLTIDHLFIFNGCADGGTTLARSGGGILNTGVTNLVRNTTFSGHSAAFGGGLSNHLTVGTIEESTFSANNATFGGALNNAGNNDLINLIRNSTFSGNTASFGGGIHNADTINQIRNSTFSGNSASTSGGGIYTGSLTTIALDNSIVTDSLNGGDCFNNAGTFNGATNLSDGSCPGTSAAVTNFDPVLKDNGCITLYASGECVMTHALLNGSNALDGGDVNATTNDQRGFEAFGTRDIGAFELLPSEVIFIDGFEDLPDPEAPP